MQSTHPEFQTVIVIPGLTVTGVLPGTTRPVGSIAITGDVHRLSCDQALELVDALLLAVMRMDVAAEHRYSTTTSAAQPRTHLPT
jgi:hypothetical protein